jgi:hypothetical protein
MPPAQKRPRIEEERVALCKWLAANGIDPNAVPLDTNLSIDTVDGDLVIRYEEFVLTEDGRKQVDPGDPELAWRRTVTAPCRETPPPWLGI